MKIEINIITKDNYRTLKTANLTIECESLESGELSELVRRMVSRTIEATNREFSKDDPCNPYPAPPLPPPPTINDDEFPF